MYKYIIKPLLFLLPPEKAHWTSLFILRLVCHIPGMKSIIRLLFSTRNSDLEKEVMGLKFRNPIGLAAGFDKNAQYIELMDLLGFGYIEIGTVTPKPQSGNPKPRLFRLSKDQALINRMGFNNEGVDAAINRLKKVKNKSIIIGGNIGKNKLTPNENAVQDYEICFDKLFPYVDYFVVNVSSPNTPGLRNLQDPDALKIIFESLQKRNEAHPEPRPILVKIAPDLELSAIAEIVDLVIEYKLAGIIATNTTVTRNDLLTDKSKIKLIGNGGLSGKPVKNRSTEIVKFIKQRAGNQLVIVGVGGIHKPIDAKEKIDAGADLIQIYTGFIYEGPATVKRICRHLV